MPPVSVIIPAYNEECGLGHVLTQLSAVMKPQEIDCEIIVVDDGSTDGTAGVVQQQEGVRLLHHYSNRGYGAALKTGIRQASHDWIAMIDADGTCPPSAIPLLLAQSDRYDMAVGARTTDE
jgi:glycosyltransferase involved in cell wall biosynthesis